MAFVDTLLKASGFRLVDRGRRGWRLKSRNVEITGGFGLALDLINWEYDDGHWSLHVHIGWPNIFIRLPIAPRKPVDDMSDSWGFSLDKDTMSCVHLHWGAKTKIVHFPWAWEFYRHSILAADGRSWISELASLRAKRDEPPIGLPANDQNRWFFISELPRWRVELPYRYVLHSGEVQERIATVSVDERECRWRWFMWLPFPRRVIRSIDVEFNGEVGERAGSWKGGCVGCGYNLLPDETPEECLRRMERERKF
jgi:hypothetical protein